MTRSTESKPGRTTIAERKKAAGWITNDTRKSLVAQGKLSPGNKNGEKCMCCRSMLNDRCSLHNFPSGVNSYCLSFSLKAKEPGRG